ncbi:hypothetical protein OZK63_42765, partial [Streptomyces sp. UMAF16]|nr:hypothetical protein [Streptomyces sp. UMAF16]
MAIVLSRLAEREADAASRDVVGAEVAGRAIVKLYALTPAVGPACTKLLDRYCDDPDRLVGMYE